MYSKYVPHQHNWHPLAYALSTSGGDPEVSLWACSGQARFGRCIATITDADLQREERHTQATEAKQRNEDEQRHFNWEK